MTDFEPTRQALDKIFKARSVALVGASGDPSKFGHMTLDSLIQGGYQGRVYPVNPKGGEIMGLKVYSGLDQLPEAPDLVAVCVPARFVAGVLREAAGLGAGGGLILSAGFREAGRPDLEAELAAVAAETGFRFAGPNIQGINYPPNRMCAMFFPVIKTRGPMAIISQSGTVTAALSEWADREGLGISAAVNLGNQTDLSESDYLEYLAGDENTGAVAMYIEGLKDGPRFLETARRVAGLKPVIILKAGSSSTGQRAAASHTGSLAGSHRVFQAVCRQFGLILAENLEHLYDAAKALALLDLNPGGRVFSFSTSGGAGTLGADAAEQWGLELPPLPLELKEELAGLGLSSLATLSNPLDLASLSIVDFEKSVMAVQDRGLAEVFLLNFGDPVPRTPELVQSLREKTRTPLAAVFFGGGREEEQGRVALHRAGVPVFPSPERAMRGLAAAFSWAERWGGANGQGGGHD